MHSKTIRALLAVVIGLAAMSLHEANPAGAEGAAAPDGYWIVDEVGEIRSFGGAAQYAPVVGSPVDMASGRDGALWVLTGDGVVHTRGVAQNFGDVDIDLLAEDEVLAAIEATPSGKGYWVITNRGRVVTRGDADRFDGLGDLELDGAIVGIASSAGGVGGYLVGADGGVFAQGEAPFLGSRRELLTAAEVGNEIVAAVNDRDGLGYWLISSDGGLFAFDAAFLGSVPMALRGFALDEPVIAATSYGAGVLMLARDGGVFVFSDLPFHGSAKGASESAAVAIATSNPRIQVTAESISFVKTLELGAGSWQPGHGFGRLWVPNRDEDTLTVIDSSTLEIVDVLDVGDKPFPVRLAWDWVWVPNVSDGTVSVIHPVTLETEKVIDIPGEPRTPQALDYKVFVASRTSPTVTVINAFTLDIIDEIEVAEGSQAALVDAFERLLWVPNTSGSTVTVIDGRTHEEVNRIAVGAAPASPTKAYDRVWVPNGDSGTITVIDPETYQQVATIDIGGKPSRPLAAFGKLFVGSAQSNDLLIIDPLDLSISTVAMEAGALMPSVAHDVIWVANPDAHKVTVVDPETFEIITTIEVDGRPRRPVIIDKTVLISTVEGSLNVFRIG
ncbi:MAG: YncE family protein [Actinomycetia bacterium]|nr:YncE family protein [Actinomycetes bacterium]